MDEEKVASSELLDQVAKSLLRASMAVDPYLIARYNAQAYEGFIKTFNTAITGLWDGIEPIDETERERYRFLAKAVLQSLGYTVPSFSHVMDPVLV